VKAVNLIPSESRRGGRGVSTSLPRSPGYIVIGVLVFALALVTIYAVTAHTISQRKSKHATLQAQTAQAQAAAAQLSDYASFQQLAQARVQTVREIAAARFDWHAAFAQLSKVVPANTSLQSLTGTVAPGASVGSAGGSASTLRGAISVPAIELTGCTATQDDVARLMSRLRLIDGVTRVTLSNSTKSGSAQSGAAVSTAGASGCGANGPSFDLVVFFSTLPGAGPTGVTSVGAQPVSNTTAGTAPASSNGGTP
jgi:Tfp pilus assembly protein PilN